MNREFFTSSNLYSELLFLIFPKKNILTIRQSSDIYSGYLLST